MATSATSTHLPSLAPTFWDEVGRELHATLVEPVDLSPGCRQLHWGPTSSSGSAAAETGSASSTPPPRTC
jgi:hypothetical protein